MMIRDVLSVPVFLILAMITYSAMWIYLLRKKVNKDEE